MQFQEKPQLLLTILEQAPECSCEMFRPILSIIFHTESFVDTISSELEGPRRLEIIGSCLSSPQFFPGKATRLYLLISVAPISHTLSSFTMKGSVVPVIRILNRSFLALHSRPTR